MQAMATCVTYLFKNGFSVNIDVNTASPPNCVVSTSISTSKDSLADDPFYLLRPIPKPDLKDFELEVGHRHEEAAIQNEEFT